MPPAKLSPRFLFSPPPPPTSGQREFIHSPQVEFFEGLFPQAWPKGGEEIMHLHIFCLTDFQYAIIGYKGR